MTTQQHAAIIGGGIIGLATALELQARGWQVTLCDSAVAAREASWAAAGMLAPFNEAHGRDPAWQRGCASLQSWEPFLRRHGISPQVVDLHRNGALLPIDDARAEERSRELIGFFSKNGVHELGPSNLKDLAPHIDCNRALWLPGGQVDPRRATMAFRRKAAENGVTL
ncbi:MAG: FAD-binding oxidoreductase, partial [Epibacterium sp.]|nr:FAD-binding oxidoreductase [Epibacterium sp.]NQX75710.1 FAD-binding oxidoreductase [Epibacterium sp.]